MVSKLKAMPDNIILMRYLWHQGEGWQGNKYILLQCKWHEFELYSKPLPMAILNWLSCKWICGESKMAEEDACPKTPLCVFGSKNWGNLTTVVQWVLGSGGPLTRLFWSIMVARCLISIKQRVIHHCFFSSFKFNVLKCSWKVAK